MHSIRIFIAALILMPLAAPAATLFPANGAKDVCPDTPLRITFDSASKLGESGKIQLFDASDNKPLASIDVTVTAATQTIGGLPHYRYHPVIINGSEADIYFPNHTMDYNKSYYVTVDAGAFSGDSGITDPSAWRFATKASPPATNSTQLTIAADGSGDFATVQGALDFVPDGNNTPITLFMRNGTYTELIFFTNKNHLTLQGEDRKKCILQYPNNARFNGAADQGIYHRGVFLAQHCTDLMLTNFTLRDTSPHGASQAEAIILNGSPNAHAILDKIDLYSFQDTLQINGQAYINDCYIEGDVDFMWGTGPCFFENCHCYSTSSKHYYTQIRNTSKNHGYVYHHCTFDGADGFKDMYLSRIAPDRFPNSEVVLIDCVLGKAVGDVGWLLNASARGGKIGDASNVHFWEYNSHDADGNAVDVSKRLDISKQLKQPDDAQTISDYSNPSYVLGGWTPQLPGQ